MSYLGTLVGTPPPVAAAARTAEPALEQPLEIESSAAPASAPVPAAGAPSPTAPELRPHEAPTAERTASVQDALRAAFEWVSAGPLTPANAAEVALPAPARSAALEIRRQPLGAPRAAAQTIVPLQVPAALQQHERTIAPPVLSQPVERERIEVMGASSETIEPTRFESPSALDLKPRRAIAAQRPPIPEAASAAEHEAPARPSPASPVQVRIGSISLNVRTPAPPAPQAAAPVVPPAAERPASSAAFAFSARRHHLRWG